MKQITNWIVDGVGHIRGDLVGADHGIRTTRVVAREGDIVTTASGSRYQLVDPPHPYLTNDKDRHRLFDGAATPLEAIDKRITAARH